MYKMPKYITFDAYGTLVNFEMTKVTMQILGERAKKINTEAFLQEFNVLFFILWCRTELC